MQRSALCRSRRELSNEYLLAKFGFDTAENEPCKVCPLSAYRSPRFLPIDYLFAPLRGHARQKIKETAKETNKGSLGMDVAIHCCFMPCATYQEALVAEATFNETSDQGDGMLSCMCLSKELCFFELRVRTNFF